MDTAPAPASRLRPSWGLGVALGAFALVRPLARTLESQLGADAGPVLAIGLTIVVTLVWIVVVGLTRAPAIPTLMLAGVTYAVLAIVASAILSPVLTGTLQGPIANPITIVPMLLMNAVWGLVAGALALLVQRMRRPRASQGRVVTPMGR
ncbi:hypothetical protein [Agrococcus jejuensis]|uniref:Uncharacterized protein n=1 Tax=Agrococcus jejuensis TaxID=399736 RepID=A0A1G8FV12_9MICO|nr:hypothetical protein [Agrococcus jejuensis]SDH85979.1 hypothetical protein SAMN04489720_2629 [Agrococcus jejuensis]